jgi:hypothetical protein
MGPPAFGLEVTEMLIHLILLLLIVEIFDIEVKIRLTKKR